MSIVAITLEEINELLSADGIVLELYKHAVDDSTLFQLLHKLDSRLIHIQEQLEWHAVHPDHED